MKAVAKTDTQLLIDKSIEFWSVGDLLSNHTLMYGDTAFDVIANRYYYSVFLAICAYACKFRQLSVGAENPEVHDAVYGLLLEVANCYKGLNLVYSKYQQLRELRGEADYEASHVKKASILDSDLIKAVLDIRTCFIDAANKDVDAFPLVECSLASKA